MRGEGIPISYPFILEMAYVTSVNIPLEKISYMIPCSVVGLGSTLGWAGSSEQQLQFLERNAKSLKDH